MTLGARSTTAWMRLAIDDAAGDFRRACNYLEARRRDGEAAAALRCILAKAKTFRLQSGHAATHIVFEHGGLVRVTAEAA